MKHLVLWSDDDLKNNAWSILHVVFVTIHAQRAWCWGQSWTLGCGEKLFPVIAFFHSASSGTNSSHKNKCERRPVFHISQLGCHYFVQKKYSYIVINCAMWSSLKHQYISVSEKKSLSFSADIMYNVQNFIQLIRALHFSIKIFIYSGLLIAIWRVTGQNFFHVIGVGLWDIQVSAASSYREESWAVGSEGCAGSVFCNANQKQQHQCFNAEKLLFTSHSHCQCA